MTQTERTEGAGFIIFAGTMMIILGIFQALWGLAALVKHSLFVISGDYLYKVNVAGWGWIHLILGIVVAFAGFAVFRGLIWARTVGVIIAGLSALGAFLNLPAYPVWGLLIIALDVFVIWALTVHGRALTGE